MPHVCVCVCVCVCWYVAVYETSQVLQSQRSRRNSRRSKRCVLGHVGEIGVPDNQGKNLNAPQCYAVRAFLIFLVLYLLPSNIQT